jgi:hypothetical protein
MVNETKKGVTYWLAGHRVYARDHVAPVVAEDVYEADGAIDGVIYLSTVPVEFRSILYPTCDSLKLTIYKEDLFATRREAIDAMAIELMKQEILFDVARDSLRNQVLTLHREEAEAEKVK